MPKLLLFAPCERVIVEQGANTISLISVLQELTVAVPSEVPQNAVSATRWYILSMWLREENEQASEFKQRVVVEDPKGNLVVQINTDVEMSKESHRTIATVEGFPVGIPGRFVLRLSLRATESDMWQEIATYPILMKHAPTQIPAATSAS